MEKSPFLTWLLRAGTIGSSMMKLLNMISSIQELSRPLGKDCYIYMKKKEARPPYCCDW